MTEELNNEEAVTEETPETPAAPAGGGEEKSKVVAGILAILIGALGIHKFYLGYTKEGIIMIVLSCLCGVGGIIGLIEGIIYLVKSDEEFEETYVKNQKPWF
jgi:TM2 domain-containing membrane protein YozV